MEDLNILKFVNEYKEAENKDKIFEQLDIKSYISVIVKKATIDAIIKNFLEVQNGLYTYDPIKKHLTFVLGMVGTYTNLSYDDDEGVASYDALVESGLLDEIIKAIGYDYGDFVNYFEETLNKKIEDNNSIPAMVSSFLVGVTAAIENLDKETLEKVLDTIKE